MCAAPVWQASHPYNVLLVEVTEISPPIPSAPFPPRNLPIDEDDVPVPLPDDDEVEEEPPPYSNLPGALAPVQLPVLALAGKES